MAIITTHVSEQTVAANDTLALMAGASISSGTVAAVSFSSNSTILWLGGTVWGNVNGVLGVATINDFGPARLAVAASGVVHGMGSGINLSGLYTLLTNEGAITGNDAITLSLGSLDGQLTLRNDGRIIGDRYGVFRDFDTDNYCDLSIVNRGLIAGASTAIASIDDDSFVSITNYGTIAGAISTAGGSDGITNRGYIIGTISTGGGNDVVNLRQSLDAETYLDLGSGEDVAELGGAGAETVEGNLGLDTASYRHGRAVTVNLGDNSLNRGAALNDELYGIENLRGSALGNDRLTGDGLANRLEGLGGNDRLAGEGGRDTMDGGLGVDTLTGGLGNDLFVFAVDEASADIVADFTKVNGNRDKVGIISDPGDANLTAGPLADANFVARADNVAQDGDDFLIFRTTDKTLWYDADGNGGLYAARLLADFADTVSLVVGDFEVF